MGCSRCGGRAKTASRLSQDSQQQRAAARNYPTLGSFVRELIAVKTKASKGSLNRNDGASRINRYSASLTNYSDDLATTIAQLIELINTASMQQIVASIDLVIAATAVNPYVPPAIQS